MVKSSACREERSLKNQQKTNLSQAKQEADNLSKSLKKEAKERARLAEMKKRLEERNLRENWFRLDNAALIYPAIGSAEWNSVFRISAIIRDKVDVEKLQQALDNTLQRYPFYNVSLREGLFWHYFQVLDTKPHVEIEKYYPCRHFEFGKKEQVFRILYLDNKISMETFHSLADGGGAMQFFNTLLVRYFEICGINYKNLKEYNLNVRDLPTIEEGEDGFRRYATKGKSKPRKEAVAFAIKGPLENQNVLKVVTGVVDVGELKKVAHDYGVTINEFLSAVYLKVMIAEKRCDKKQAKKPVKLSVPVNCRRFFPTKTMRNFSQFINIEIPVDKEDGTFAMLLEIVKEQSKNFNKDYLQQSINTNINSEKNFFVRIIPLGLKDFVLKMVYNRVGERLFTSTLSNLGLCKLPEELNDKILNYHVALGATKLNRINLTAVTFNEKCSLTFSTRLVEMRVIREFFLTLAELGLKVEIFSNI